MFIYNKKAIAWFLLFFGQLNAQWGVMTSDGKLVLLTAERKARLQNASEYFRSAFSNTWRESQEKVLAFEQVSAPTFTIFEQILTLDQSAVSALLRTKTLAEVYALAQFIDYLHYRAYDAQIMRVLAEKMMQSDALYGYTGKCVELSDRLRAYVRTFLPMALAVPSASAVRLLGEPMDHAELKIALEGTMLVQACDTVARLFDLQTGACIQTFLGHEAPIECVMIAGNEVIAGSRDGVVRVWDINSGECVRALHTGRDEPIVAVLTQDDKIVAQSGDHTLLYVWNKHNGQQLRTITGGERFGQMVLGTPEELIVMPGERGDCAIRIYNIRTGVRVRVLNGHTDIVAHHVLTTYGILVTASVDHRVVFWNVRTGACVCSTERQPAMVQCVKSVADGRVIVGLLDGDVIVFSEMGTPIRTIKSRAGMHFLANLTITDDGRLITSDFDGRMQVFDLQTYRCLSVLESSSQTPLIESEWKRRLRRGEIPAPIEFSSTGALVAVADGMPLIVGGLFIPVNTLSIEQVLLVLKIVRGKISQAHIDNERLCAVYRELPLATVGALFEYVPKTCLALNASAGGDTVKV